MFVGNINNDIKSHVKIDKKKLIMNYIPDDLVKNQFEYFPTKKIDSELANTWRKNFALIIKKRLD